MPLLTSHGQGFLCGLLLLAAVGGYLLAHTYAGTSTVVLFVTVLLLGLGQGAEADFIAFFALKMFGLKAYSKVVGIYAMVAGLGMAAGAFIYARLYDAYGSYIIACEIGAACFVLSGVFILATRLADRITASMQETA